MGNLLLRLVLGSTAMVFFPLQHYLVTEDVQALDRHLPGIAPTGDVRSLEKLEVTLRKRHVAGVVHQDSQRQLRRTGAAVAPLEAIRAVIDYRLRCQR